MELASSIGLAGNVSKEKGHVEEEILTNFEANTAMRELRGSYA